MPSFIVFVLVLMESISGIQPQPQDTNITFLDFENDFGGWNISVGNWNRSMNPNVFAGFLATSVSTIEKRTEGAGGTVY